LKTSKITEISIFGEKGWSVTADSPSPPPPPPLPGKPPTEFSGSSARGPRVGGRALCALFSAP